MLRVNVNVEDQCLFQYKYNPMTTTELIIIMCLQVFTVTLHNTTTIAVSLT